LNNFDFFYVFDQINRIDPKRNNVRGNAWKIRVDLDVMINNGKLNYKNLLKRAAKT
jgi:hypothetical protein